MRVSAGHNVGNFQSIFSVNVSVSLTYHGAEVAGPKANHRIGRTWHVGSQEVVLPKPTAVGLLYVCRDKNWQICSFFSLSWLYNRRVRNVHATFLVLTDIAQGASRKRPRWFPKKLRLLTITSTCLSILNATSHTLDRIYEIPGKIQLVKLL